MAGTVVENLSNRKLSYILLALLLAEIVFFLVGAWYAPVPSSTMEYEMIKCRDSSSGKTDKWFHIRPKRCNIIEDLSSFTPSSFDLREIVFVAQMPHVRDRVQLEYSPWFQFLLGLLQVEVEYSDVFKTEKRRISSPIHDKLRWNMQKLAEMIDCMIVQPE
ncbi:hypothetical protein NECAME_02135 [Necator americanus]|uniref:Wntless GOLD domain-containing protein n=1 Tax=Necator americanus TaxID=51031 RepID=W2THC3_NECAM|nr:hypothetical protein NECAME_02135 [Necator americanus]ETN81455.1 hypothetical protein NECAME_02135 [Necator americanus]